MIPKFPFNTEIESGRIARNLGRVWERLPAEARPVIAARLYLVTDLEKHWHPDYCGALTCGYGYMVPGKGFIVYLNPKLLGKSPAERVQRSIAHELAHVFCNHVPLPVINAHEADFQADCQVMLWGYEPWYPSEGVTAADLRAWHESGGRPTE